MTKTLALMTFLLATTVQAASIKLVTFNTFMIPKPINFSFQRKRAPLIAEALRSRDNDVMVFQETFSGRARKKIINSLKDLYPHYARQKGTFLRMNSGLLVMSKFPMEVLETIHFDDCTTTDCFSAKGAMLVLITLPQGEKVQIATTHLQAWNTEKSQIVRAKQLEEIYQLMRKYADPKIAQVLAGDLNIDGKIPEHEYNHALAILGMESLPPVGGPQATNGFPVPCYKIPGGEDGGEWLDHIFLKKNGTLASVTDKRVVPLMGMIKGELCPLSDHYSVEAQINL